jgi:hypothetical protein
VGSCRSGDRQATRWLMGCPSRALEAAEALSARGTRSITAGPTARGRRASAHQPAASPTTSAVSRIDQSRSQPANVAQRALQSRRRRPRLRQQPQTMAARWAHAARNGEHPLTADGQQSLPRVSPVVLLKNENPALVGPSSGGTGLEAACKSPRSEPRGGNRGGNHPAKIRDGDEAMSAARPRQATQPAHVSQQHGSR